MRKSAFFAGIVLAASVSSTGCLFRKAKAQPPAAPIPAPPPTVAQKPEPIAPPPKVDEQKPDLGETPVAAQDIDVPKPPPAQPKRPPRRPPQSTPATVSDAAPAAVPNNPQPDPPRLVQLLTPAEEKRYQMQLDQYLKNVDAALGQAAARTLTGEQSEVVQRVRTFSQQARDRRDTDLVTAHNLAQRADVLAQDLMKGFR